MVEHVVLVTHASHMRRAKLLFEHAGLKVLPAPVNGAVAIHSGNLAAWLPSASALNESSRVMHEYLGLLWYASKGIR